MFDDYVTPGAPDACWLWTGYRNPDGYGKFGQTGAHRLAWERANGRIPDGMHVCHRCDVRACCNPAHLFLGTHADNMRDRDAKGRNVALRGEACGAAKLKAEDIPVIRRLAREGVSQRKIAAAFGMSRSMIQFIIARRSWQHVPG